MNRQHPNFSELSNQIFDFTVPVSPVTNKELTAHGFKTFSPNKFSAFYEKGGLWGWGGQVLSYILSSTHCLIHGETGSGKNYTVEYIAHKLNRPFMEFSFKVGSNPNDMIARSSLENENGATVSRDVDGNLVKACRGVTIYRDGKKVVVPAIIVFSDVDRAPPEFFEILREALEDGAERINDPLGRGMIEIAQGTVFCFTANRGLDEAEEGMITNAIDASMGSRVLGVEAEALKKGDLKKILSMKYGNFTKDQVDLLVDCFVAMKNTAKQECIDVLGLSARNLVAMGKVFNHMRPLLPSDRDGARYACLGIINKLKNEGFKIALHGAIDPLVKSDVIENDNKDDDDDDDVAPCDR